MKLDPVLENLLNSYKLFILYFKDKAQKLIQEAMKHNLSITKHMLIADYCLSAPPIGEEKQEILRLLEPNKYRLRINESDVSITQREYNTLRNYVQGYTSKEIAKTMGLSYRTIEDHMERVRNKLGIYRRTDLLKLVTELGILFAE